MDFGRSSIRSFLQPAYLIVPEDHGSVRCDREPLWGYVLRHQRAPCFVDTVERAAGRVVGDPASSAGNDTVDSGGEIGVVIGAETEPEQTAQKAACKRLRRRLGSFDDPDALGGGIGNGEGFRRDG